MRFFRRRHLKNPTFAERLDTLRNAGFAIAPLAGGMVRASRGGCAVEPKDEPAWLRGAKSARWRTI
ncbi:MAG: hypothetical protein WBL65_20105 [Bryobacteraceae bacterium]